MKTYELFQVFHTYFPIIFSINYQRNGRLFAFINYGHFTKDSNNQIKGVQITKQYILVPLRISLTSSID